MEEVVTTKSKPAKKNKRNFFSRTKFYLFEYTSMQVSNLWLGASFSIVIFSLFSVVSGNSRASDIVETLAWIFGIILVFAPISITLYARTSGEEEVHPARLHQRFRKFVFYVMLTIVVISAVSFLIAAIYAASRVAFGLGETKSLVSVALPSLLTLALYAYFIVFVIKGTVVPPKLRKFNIVAFSVLCTFMLLLVAGTAVVSGRDVTHDKKIVKDLESTSTAINQEYKNSGKLPVNIESLASLSSSDIKAKFKSGEYTYEQTNRNTYYDQPVELQDDLNSSSTSPDTGSGTDSSMPSAYLEGSYKLCATFKTSTSYDDVVYTNYAPDYSYNDGRFDYHQKGKDCFTLYAY